MNKFDVAVIGSGPGGYVAAIRCAQLGMSVALVERYQSLGGTCLNVGCIPSKAYLDSSERFFQMKHQAGLHGLLFQGLSVDWPAMKERVSKVVKQTCDGIQFLMKKNKIQVFYGHASFKGPHLIEVGSGSASALQQIEAAKIIVATGSKPNIPSFIPFDRERIISSTEALKLKEIPKTMLVLGAGAIGLEMGSVFARLGTKVTIIERAPGLLPLMDGELGRELQKVLKKEGMDFYLGANLTAVEKTKQGVQVKLTLDGQETLLQGDYLLVATGRKPFTDNLGLEQIGVKPRQDGKLEVDEHKRLKSEHQHIFAIGDLIDGPMLAHKASEDGVFVAETLAGQRPHLNYHLVPNVVYLWPEVASVGATEEELKQQGRTFKKGNFPMKASGRARASEEFFGFSKILACDKTDEILGVHLIAPRASDLIAVGVIAMEYRATAEDLARLCYAHPTYSETMKEAATLAWQQKTIHL